MKTLTTNLPANKDPYLSELPPNEIKYVEIGFLYFQYLQLISNNSRSEADKILEQIHIIAPNFLEEN